MLTICCSTCADAAIEKRLQLERDQLAFVDNCEWKPRTRWSLLENILKAWGSFVTTIFLIQYHVLAYFKTFCYRFLFFRFKITRSVHWVSYHPVPSNDQKRDHSYVSCLFFETQLFWLELRAPDTMAFCVSASGEAQNPNMWCVTAARYIGRTKYPTCIYELSSRGRLCAILNARWTVTRTNVSGFASFILTLGVGCHPDIKFVSESSIVKVDARNYSVHIPSSLRTLHCHKYGR